LEPQFLKLRLKYLTRESGKSLKGIAVRLILNLI
jgi:hypothetical protein